MTNEEAISKLKMAIAEVEWQYAMDYAVAFELAIEALEKQNPMKLYTADRGCIPTYCCKRCNTSLYRVEWFEAEYELRNMDYCDNCGQAIDWSEAKNEK